MPHVAMVGPVALAALLAAAGCATRTAPEPVSPPAPSGASEPDRPAVATEERAAFLVRRGTDPLVAESFTRIAERIDAEVLVADGGQRVTYRAVLEPDATVSRMDVRAFEDASEGAPAARSLLVELGGPAARIEIASAGAMRERTVEIARGAIPVLPFSFAMFEQIVRRALRVGGDPVEVPVLALDNLEATSARVSFPEPGAATILFRGADGTEQTIEVRHTAGRLLGGAIATQDLRFERTTPQEAVAALD